MAWRIGVEHAGAKADLWEDVAAARAKFWREASVTVPPDAELVGAALLMRLGESELARRMLLKVPALPVRRLPATESEQQRLDKVNWFEAAGTSWLSGAFHESVVAHAAGDDRLAVDIAESLLTERPAFESAWKSLGPVISPNDTSPTAFLDPVPVLLADSERRLKESSRPPFAPIAIRQMARSERISALIDRLEDVDEQQFSQPGGVWLMGSPICKMLAEEGVDAIDRLLDVLDHDKRLTRSYSFGRNFFPPRHLISVSEAAEAVLKAYYQLDVFRWEDASERRAWLVRNKYRSVADRSLDLLADDSSYEVQWLDAAQMLLRTNKSGVVGDELRGRRNPSVSELLAKRATEMKTNWADDMGLLLYQWDPAAALPTLQMLAHRWWTGAQNGRIAAARLQLGDVAAAREWAAAIKGDQSVPLDQLVPLWTSPGDENLKALARELFAEPRAPMSPVGMLVAGRYPRDLIRSPLLIEDVFRECVLAGLERTEEIGSVERLPSGALEVRAGGLSMSSTPGPGPHAPPGKRSIRIGDFIAWQLSLIDGFSKFDIEWSPAEKNAAVAATAEFLRTHADDLRAPAVTANATPSPVVLLVRK